MCDVNSKRSFGFHRRDQGSRRTEGYLLRDLVNGKVESRTLQFCRVNVDSQSGAYVIRIERVVGEEGVERGTHKHINVENENNMKSCIQSIKKLPFRSQLAKSICRMVLRQRDVSEK